MVEGRIPAELGDEAVEPLQAARIAPQANNSIWRSMSAWFKIEPQRDEAAPAKPA